MLLPKERLVEVRRANTLLVALRVKYVNIGNFLIQGWFSRVITVNGRQGDGGRPKAELTPSAEEREPL